MYKSHATHSMKCVTNPAGNEYRMLKNKTFKSYQKFLG